MFLSLHHFKRKKLSNNGNPGNLTIPAPLFSVIEPGIFLHDLTFGLCFGLEGCELYFDMLLLYLYAIELEERKNVRNICHAYPDISGFFLLPSTFFLTYYLRL